MFSTHRISTPGPGFALVLACIAACGPYTSSGPDRSRGSLEDQLSAIAPSRDARASLRRAGLLRALGQQEQALDELKDATQQAREDVDWSALDRLWRARGDVHLELGDPEGALKAFGNRLELSASLEQGAVRASALADSAYAFLLLGRVGQADHAVAEAKVVGGDALARDPLAQERLGLIAQALGDEDSAARHLARAAREHDRNGDRVSAVRARVFAAHIGDNRGPRLDALDAETAELLDPGPRARLRMYQAEASLVARSYAPCHERAAQAIGLADRRGLRLISKLARIIAARCAEQSRNLAAAIEHASEAADLIEDQLGQVTGALARQELGFEAFQLYRLLVSLEVRQGKPGYVKRAFSLSERARGRAHLDAVVRSEVARFSSTLPIPPALARDRQEARERVRRLTDALVASRSGRNLAARHRDALWALEEINEAIKGSNPLLSRVATPLPATVVRVRKRLLKGDSALLSYFVTHDSVLVFAISSESEALAVLPGSAADIDAAVRRYRDRFLLDPDSDLDELRKEGAALYRTLIQPVKKQVEGKRRLVIVPHGALAALPFESLVNAKGNYLVQDVDVQYSVSATLATVLAKRRRKGNARRRAFIGLGDPVYDWAAYQRGAREGDALAASRGLELWRSAVRSGSGAGSRPGAGATRDAPLGLERIPGTARELEEIAKLFGNGATIHLRARAGEELVKSGALSGHRIIHIASHGLMTAHYQALALTLDPGSKEDGFLMSSEIAELELDADLVVLSACRTGDTRSRSAEPVAGMALSLRSAGARSVMLSLWSVDDEATADLMVKFYRPLVRASPGYSSSLARAKRAMIDSENQHPYYWAPFILHGP